ncbi:MAG: carboxypeptidase regulatory-like domain-containing protein [Terracidiphilus sp.]
MHVAGAQLGIRKCLRAVMLTALIGAFGFAVMSRAQSTYGSLSGQVTDSTGAVVASAEVTLTDVDTNYTQTTKSDGSGVYSFKLVSSGHYSLAISATGFAQYVQNGIVINANEYATQNIQMKVAKVGATITVTANTELIDTTTPELGMTVNTTAMSDLPLLGRDPTSLALLAPGMVDAGKAGVSWAQSGFSFPSEAAASANGGRIGSTFYMLDGVSNMDTYLGSSSPAPNPDAIQEFRLITNNFSAAYGFSTGGVVSEATKSGSNTWHGGLFEFMRNGDFDAGNWNNHSQDTYRQNVFGGYVGGPAIKNKVFFFFNYQGTDIVGGPGSTNNSTYTPTLQMMSGDFSSLVTYQQSIQSAATCGGVGGQIPAGNELKCGELNGPFTNTVTSGVYKYNQLIGGANGLDPVAAQVTNDGLPGHVTAASGTANATSAAQNDLGNMLYASANLANQKFNQYTARADYDISSNQRLTVRSFVDKWIQPAGDTPGNVLSVLNLNTWNQTFGIQGWYFNEIAQHTWTVNPTTVNTITLLWTQQSVHNGTPVLDKNGKPMCWSRYIAITEPVCYMEGANFGGANGGWTEPSDEVRGTIGLTETLIKTVGRHTLSIGSDIIHQRAVENASNYPADAIIGFGGGYTNSGLADWLLGYMSSYEQGSGELADIQGWIVDPYFNDEYRLTPNITLDLGLRWDPDFAPVSVGGRGTAFVPGQQSVIFPAAPVGLVYPGDGGVDEALRPSSPYFFEPRVGVAWQPKRLPHTSVHAAFGIFSGPVPYSDYNHVVDMAPFAPAYSPYAPSNTPICSSGGTQATCAPNSGQAIAGYENFEKPWNTSTFGTPNGNPFGTGPGQIPWASPNYKPPMNSTVPTPVYEQDSFGRNFHAGKTQAWNFAVEQQLSNAMALRVAYVGSESYHQSYVQDDNYAAYGYCTYYNNANCPVPSLANKNNGTLKTPVAPYAPTYSTILEYDSGATADYHSLQVAFQRHMANGLQLQSSFTWQKTMDVASAANIAASQSGITDPRDLRWSRGVSSSSIPFTWTTNFVLRSPEFRGQNLIVREALAGWELAPIMTWQSGSPFSIGAGNDQQAYGEANNGDGCLAACGGDRADRVPGVPLKVRQGGRSSWTKQYFNTAAFVTRHDGTFGDSARDIIHGPPGFNTDASLMKNWSIVEKYSLELRFELYNAFNHAIMGNPDTTPTDGTYGAIGGANGNNGFGSPSNTTRVGQAALKFTF